MLYLPTTTYVLYFYSFDICSNLVQGLGGEGGGSRAPQSNQLEWSIKEQAPFLC